MHARVVVQGAVALALLWVGGCGGDDMPGSGTDGGSTPDGGAGTSDAGWTIAAPALPMAAALPQLTPCPSGWSERDVDGVAVCEPWASGESTECPNGWARFPGDAACARVGTECGDGDYATDLPAGASLRYVQAGGRGGGGDGSMARPFGTIAQALADATPGTVIALSKGTFDEAVTPPAGVTLWGACAEQTVLTNSSRTDDSVVTVTTAGVVLRNLTVGPTPKVGVKTAGEGATLTMNGVIVDGATLVGVWIDEGSSATAQDLVVRDTVQEAGSAGHGVLAQRGAVADIDRAVLERNGGPAAGAFQDGVLRLRSAVVRDTVPDATGELGIGAAALLGGLLEISTSLFEGNRLAAIFTDHAGSRLILEQAVLRDTAPRLVDGVAGMAILAHPGSDVRVLRTLIERSSTEGVQLSAATGHLEDIVVAETRIQEMDQASGRGMAFQNGSTAALRRVMLSRNHEVGLYANNVGTILQAEDLTIVQTRPVHDGTFGMGLMMRGEARLEATRLLVDAAHEAGIVITHAATAELEDVVVRGTLPRQTDSDDGRGLWVQEGGRVTLRRGLLEDNRMTGLGANGDGVSLVAEDLTVRRTRSRLIDGTVGRGLNVQNGASAEIRRAVFEDTEEVSIVVSTGATATASDIVVRRTLQRGCAATTCAGAAAGIGVGVYGGSFELERFQIADAPLCGVQVARAGELDLLRGEVRETLVGACVQVPDYDFDRLSNQVRYSDNEANLDSRDLPVPDAVDATPYL